MARPESAALPRAPGPSGSSHPDPGALQRKKIAIVSESAQSDTGLANSSVNPILSHRKPLRRSVSIVSDSMAPSTSWPYEHPTESPPTGREGHRTDLVGWVAHPHWMPSALPSGCSRTQESCLCAGQHERMRQRLHGIEAGGKTAISSGPILSQEQG